LREIIACLKGMPQRVRGNLSSALTNGKVETHLKTLMGITWATQQRRGRPRSFLMDKKLGAPLDLVAFEQGVPQFWIEAKSDFVADELSVERSASRALAQVRSYAQRVPTELRECPAYIVHFLCPLPDDEQYPGWVEVFDRLRENREYALKELEDYYRSHNQFGLMTGIRKLTIDFKPQIGAVVVEVDTDGLRNI